MNTRVAKYRPSLTSDEVTAIYALLTSPEAPNFPEKESLTKLFMGYILKIDAGLLSAAYVAKPVSNEPAPATNGSPADWEAAYNKLLLSGAESLTAKEAAYAQEHRYLNGLMNDSEKAEFEASLNLGI